MDQEHFMLGSRRYKLCVIGGITVCHSYIVSGKDSYFEKDWRSEVCKETNVCQLYICMDVCYNLALTYIIYLHLTKLQLRNNMYLLLAVSEQKTITLFEYTFQIVIITLDIACLILLCVCSISILIIFKSSNRSVAQMSAKSPTSRIIVKLATKISLLIFCNALCWIPILTVATLLLLDVSVNENVINWIAILVIPISSTTNPVLYSNHVVAARMKILQMYFQK